MEFTDYYYIVSLLRFDSNQPDTPAESSNKNVAFLDSGVVCLLCANLILTGPCHQRNVVTTVAARWQHYTSQVISAAFVNIEIHTRVYIIPEYI